jgi:diadenosine tetraphosphate (Ap4A) HIT family hydrolase
MDRTREITDIAGNKKRVKCLSCAIEKGGVARHGGSIASTAHFDAHQDWEIPIPGFVIVASRRHLQSIDEFTDEERGDFIEFLCMVRRAMREALDIQTAYLIQEEDTSDHFHVWMFPRYEWMAE